MTMRVGYQGVPGAYSEEALRACLPDAEPVPYRTLRALFAALLDGQIDLALAPVENSYAGSVVEAYDLMVDYPVTIVREWIHPVNHALLGVPGADLAGVERVFSHPQALAQTATFLGRSALHAEPYYDTAGAAQMVAERGDPSMAAVASRLAGEFYGLSVLADDIQDSPHNATRFVLVAPHEWSWDSGETVHGPAKTSIVFATEHKPGALVRALSCLARQGVNLVRLESRPSRERPWEYLFFADVDGSAREPRQRTALRELSRLVPFLRILGSYSAAAG